jgi:hypothetical protein
MLKNLILNTSPVFWIVFHILLGFMATISPFPIIAWFYFVVLTSGIYLLRDTQSPFILIAFIFYLVSFELLSRMAQTFPFIPYELGKYLLLVGMMWGILKYKTFGLKGWIMLICLVPALFIDVSGLVAKSDIIFNLLGPLNVALVVIFFTKMQISVRQLGHLCRLSIYPVIGVLAYTILKNPDLSEIEFELGTNLDLSGGFGANQVSTLFGFGAFLTFVMMITRQKLSGYFVFDALLLFAFSFQGLLTFSRGGMLGGLIGVIIILFFIRNPSKEERRKFQLPQIGKLILPILFLTLMSYLIVDQLTDGTLSLRYMGETVGTVAGTKAKSINSITTGRFDILVGDLELWRNNFFLGVGAGASKFLRLTMNSTVAHVEMSRLLAEHGIFGLIYFLILCSIGFNLFKSNPNPLYKGLALAFFIIAIYTTFHAAMRTYVTPVLIGLSLLYVKNSVLQKKKAEPEKSLIHSLEK